MYELVKKQLLFARGISKNNAFMQGRNIIPSNYWEMVLTINSHAATLCIGGAITSLSTKVQPFMFNQS